MPWNYRIILHDDDPDPAYHHYMVHRVYYSKRGRIEAWGESCACIGGDTLEELLQDLARLLTDCETLDVLSLSELERDRNRWYRRLRRWLDWQWLELWAWFHRRK